MFNMIELSFPLWAIYYSLVLDLVSINKLEEPLKTRDLLIDLLDYVKERAYISYIIIAIYIDFSP